MPDFLRVGNVVQLKAGGPEMIIEEIADYSLSGIASQAKCVWSHENRHNVAVFDLTALEKKADAPAKPINRPERSPELAPDSFFDSDPFVQGVLQRLWPARGTLTRTHQLTLKIFRPRPLHSGPAEEPARKQTNRS